MAKGRIASVVQTKLVMVLYGEAFTGKSTLASQLAYFKRPDGKPFRILYLDPENGSIDDYLSDMEDNGVNLNNIYIVYTQSLGEVRQYVAKVKNNEDFYQLDEDGEETDEVVVDAENKPFRADAIVIDGTTILNLTTKQGLIEFSKKRNKVKADRDGLVGDARVVKVEGAGLEWKDYDTVNFKGQNLILDLAASGVHCIVTAREADEKISVQDSTGKASSITTGKKIPDGFKSITYNAKTVLRMYVDSETGEICAHVDKDRTGVHKQNEVIEDPTLLDWQSVIDKTANKSSFTIKNDLTKAVDIEESIYTKDIINDINKIEHTANKSTASASTDNADAEELKKKIVAKRNSLAPDVKTAKKEELKSANLPTAYKNVNDIAILQQVLDILSK